MIISVDLLKEPKETIRDYTGDDLTTLKAEIYKSGLRESIVIDEDFVIVSGVRRFRAMKEMGWLYIPCRYVQGWEVKVAMQLMDKRRNHDDHKG